jgi:hypothetical protein
MHKLSLNQKPWAGKYPYQVRVRPIGKIVALSHAAELLRFLGIKENLILTEETALKLSELFCPRDLQINDWLEKVKNCNGEPTLEMDNEIRKWEHFYDTLKTLTND